MVKKYFYPGGYWEKIEKPYVGSLQKYYRMLHDVFVFCHKFENDTKVLSIFSNKLKWWLKIMILIYSQV